MSTSLTREKILIKVCKSVCSIRCYKTSQRNYFLEMLILFLNLSKLFSELENFIIYYDSINIANNTLYLMKKCIHKQYLKQFFRHDLIFNRSFAKHYDFYLLNPGSSPAACGG